MASHSYPEGARTGDVITGLNEAGQLADPLEGVHIFHAGTAKRGDHFVTNGGRVLMVSAHADTHVAARALAYAAVDRITFDGAVLRRDIAARVGQ
jgi:phosphoribosylamine--glycine ligase